jgi:ABC-type branched-subunit amino acid transport system substrate-binding protein
MRKTGFLALLTAVLLIFQPIQALGEKGSEGYTSSDKPVIGIILPFSSPFSDIAREQKNAVELAVSEIRPKASIVFADGKSSPEDAVKAFDQLAGAENKPVAIISCSSWASTAIHPLAAEKNIFHIAIGSAVIAREAEKSTVRFTLDAKNEERQLASYLSGFTRIAVFNMDNSLGNNWAEIIKENFGEKVVASMPYNPGSDNFKDMLNEIKNTNPDVLVLISAGNGARIAKQAREIGINAQLVGTRPIERPELLDEPAADGLIYTYPSHSFTHPMLDAYEKTYKTRPTFFGIEAYDAISTLLSAIDAGYNTPGAFFDWYAGKSFTGALGVYQFDEKGDAFYPYMYKEIRDRQFKVADFQFPVLLEKTRQEINKAFRQMDRSLENAAGRLAATGFKGQEAEKILRKLYKKNPYAFDCKILNPEGKIIRVFPDDKHGLTGLDLSDRNYIRRLHQSRKPVVSQAIDTIEGFAGFELQHPVFDKNGRFSGSVGMITKPGFFGEIITGKVANFPVEIWMMQKDGRMIYDVNKEELGKNLFTDKIYANHPSLLEIGRQMSIRPQGSGQYSFLDKTMERIAEKNLIWNTVALHGTEFRLALVHVDDDLQ